MDNIIYIRTLKRVDYSVFCVSDSQKTYYDFLFNRYMPYSSGQQVKRCLLERLCDVLGVKPSPTTFMLDYDGTNIKEGEVHTTCDPSYPDQLLGGWMKASKGGTTRTLNRRSPLSISIMDGLHPALCGIQKEIASFDRSDRDNNVIKMTGPDGELLTQEEVEEIIDGKDRSVNRKWIDRDKNKRATGLFKQSVAIDLRRLFSVSVSRLEPEITVETQNKLVEEGWVRGSNRFGDCLVAPKDVRTKLIDALVKAILTWKITSNQSRTFSMMETLAIAVSSDANAIGQVMYAIPKEKGADPIFNENMPGVTTFVAANAPAYINCTTETPEAFTNAEKYLIELLNSFEYENQIL